LGRFGLGHVTAPLTSADEHQIVLSVFFSSITHSLEEQ
jgi:hypothetical protein